jgi:tetratricopeptide (TPR) repeat protein
MHLTWALDLFGELDDVAGQAETYHFMAILSGLRGRPRDGARYHERAAALFRKAGVTVGYAAALNGVGWFHVQFGEYGEALASCRQALDLLRELGDGYGQAQTLDSIGYAHHHLGDYPQALACFQEALELYQAVGDRSGPGTTLHHLGDTHHAAGDPDAARDAWERALTILDGIGHPEAAKVRTKLVEHDPLLPQR